MKHNLKTFRELSEMIQKRFGDGPEAIQNSSKTLRNNLKRPCMTVSALVGATTLGVPLQRRTTIVSSN